jgi:hypothetical protein
MRFWRSVRALGHHADRNVVWLLGASLLLCLPAWANGRPFLSPDTDVYFYAGRLARDAMAGLFGQAAPHDAVQSDAALFMSARSTFYGLFAYASERIGTLWLTVFLQALACAWMIQLCARSLCPGRERLAFAGVIGLLTCCSALPLFATFVVPDVFAGVVLLATALLVVFPEKLAAPARGLAMRLLAASLLFHVTYFVVAGTALIVGLTLLRLRPMLGSWRSAARLPALALVAAIAIGAAAAGLSRLGPAPAHYPPFLTARLLADGPGRDKIDQICAVDKFAICAFSNQPLDNSEDILWSFDPSVGVFSLASRDERARLVVEDQRFALAVIKAAPLSAAWSAARNAIAQFFAIGLDPQFAIDARRWRDMARGSFPELTMGRIGACSAAAVSCAPRLPLATMAQAHVLVTLLSVLYLLLRLAQPPFRRSILTAPVSAEEKDCARFLLFMAMIFVGLIANAIICGALSGVFPRYQTRLIWLLPMMSVLLAVRYPQPFPVAWVQRRLIRR